jgi:hypothetical protein
MIKHLNILLSVFLIALFAGGCNNEGEKIGGMLGPPCLFISFIDSEGQDLVTGIPTVKVVTPVAEYAGDFLSSDVYRMKLFVNEEEFPTQNDPLYMSIRHKDGTYELYDAILFSFGNLMKSVDDKSNFTVYTVRCEVVCEYVFGNDETHILTGELSRPPGGTYDFQRFWFDGVEIPFGVYPPGLDITYPADGWKPDAYFVQVNR